MVYSDGGTRAQHVPDCDSGAYIANAFEDRPTFFNRNANQSLNCHSV